MLPGQAHYQHHLGNKASRFLQNCCSQAAADRDVSGNETVAASHIRGLGCGGPGPRNIIVCILLLARLRLEKPLCQMLFEMLEDQLCVGWAASMGFR